MIKQNVIKLKSITISGFKSFNSDEHTIEFGDVAVLTQLAIQTPIIISYSKKSFLSDSSMGDYDFFSHFRIGLFKI